MSAPNSKLRQFPGRQVPSVHCDRLRALAREIMSIHTAKAKIRSRMQTLTKQCEELEKQESIVNKERWEILERLARGARVEGCGD
jgi:hypothetical protein